MGKSYSLSRLVLRSGATKEVENPLVVLGIDAAAIVGDFENRKAQLGPALNRDVAGNSGPEIFDGVVDEVGENLFQREAVADDLRQRSDANLGVGLRGLVCDGRDDAFDHVAGV